jgi:DNA replication and repair protein RecF
VTTSCAVRALHLAQFRSYPAARLVLDARPVAVVGANGAGKTNLLEAVSLLSPGRGLRRAAAEDLAFRGAAAWRVSAEVERPGGRREIVTEAQGAGRRVEIDGKAAAQAALGEALRVLWLTPALDRLWLDAPAERRRYLDRVALSLVPDHGEAALGYERSLRERNRLIRDGTRDRAWFAAIEAQMAAHGARLAANRRAAVARLAAAQEDGAFPAARLAIETAAPEDEAGLAAALVEGRTRDMAAGRTLTGPHRDDLAAAYAAKDVPARLCSTGEQKALLLSLALANARAVTEDFGAAPLLLLDEVAAHLDAERRAALLAAILALGAQAWMTGTGREVFPGLDDRAQWLEVRETADGSVVAA